MLPLITPRDRESPTVAVTSRKNSNTSKPFNPSPPRHVEISQPIAAADSTQVHVKDLEPLQLGQYDRECSQLPDRQLNNASMYL